MRKIECEGNMIEYTVEKKKRKTICIKIKEDGSVTVSAPTNTSLKYIENLVKEKGEWILAAKKKMLERLNSKVVREIKEGSTFLYMGREYPLHLIYDNSIKKINISLNKEDKRFTIKTNTDDEETIKKELEKWYRQRTMEIVLEKINIYAHEFKDKVTQVKVKEQKRRWASCTYKNAILFNWRISMAREEAIEYIVVHEMCHFDYKNHSKDFWNRVESIMPDYKKQHEYLKQNGINMYI